MPDNKKRLKYARDHQKCGESCTVRKWDEKRVAAAYRLVTRECPVEDDFLPPAKMGVPRTFSTKPPDCRALALSFFTTKSKAVKHRKKLAKNSKYWKEKLRFLCRTHIEKEDGRVSGVASNGHFGMHEYVDNAIVDNAHDGEEIG